MNSLQSQTSNSSPKENVLMIIPMSQAECNIHSPTIHNVIEIFGPRLFPLHSRVFIWANGPGVKGCNFLAMF